MMRRAKIDYSGFIKLRDKNTNKIEAARCLKCNKLLITIADKRLKAHRRSCKEKQKAIDLHEHGTVTNDYYNKELDIADKKEILDKDLANFFLSGAIPFLKVENPYFLRFIRNLGRFSVDYKPPDRRALASSVMRRIHNEIVEKKQQLLQNTDGVLLLDGWRNKSDNRKYLVFSIKNVNTPLVYLTFVDMSVETEHAENLKSHINEAIKLAKEEYGCYIYAILSDNDKKIVKGGELARTIDDKILVQSTCSSHSGNLLIKCFADQELLQIIREIVTTFREPKLEALLIRAKGTRLQNFPETRFCYLRDTCQSILDNLPQLRRLINVPDIALTEQVKERIRNRNFEILLHAVIENLDPICKLINACQSPAVNAADATEIWLTLKLSSDEYNNQIAERISRALRPVNFAANLLHPQYNGQNLNEEQMEKAENYLATYLSQEAQREFALYNQTRESYNKLAMYCRDPVDYWKIVKISLPTLSEEVIRLQLIPASTASLEGLFSQWTYVHSYYRNRLGDEKSSVLTFIIQ